MLATVEGVYRNGKVELAEVPGDLSDNTPVIVTFLTRRLVDLRMYNISEADAAELRARLMTFAEDWESAEMDIYDDYDQFKVAL